MWSPARTGAGRASVSAPDAQKITFDTTLDIQSAAASKNAPLVMKPIVHEVAPVARTWWLHMSPKSTSNIDRASQYNISRFAELNPDYSVTLMSDDPDRIRSAWQEETRPQNLKIEKVDYNFGAEYPRVAQVTEGIMTQLPQLSKDLLSYKFLSEQSGIVFDVDINWRSALPFPLHLKEKAAVHQKFENGFIASSAEKQDSFKFMLDDAEKEIPVVFAITEDKDNKTRFTPTHTGFASLQNAVNTIEYENFIDFAQQIDVGNLENYVKYDIDPSSYPRHKPPLAAFRVTSRQGDSAAA